MTLRQHQKIRTNYLTVRNFTSFLKNENPRIAKNECKSSFKYQVAYLVTFSAHSLQNISYSCHSAKQNWKKF